jgi:hypothetical protein
LFYRSTTSRLMSDVSRISKAEMAYYRLRSMVSALLASLFPLRCDEAPIKKVPLVFRKRTGKC